MATIIIDKDLKAEEVETATTYTSLGEIYKAQAQGFLAALQMFANAGIDPTAVKVASTVVPTSTHA